MASVGTPLSCRGLISGVVPIMLWARHIHPADGQLLNGDQAYANAGARTWARCR
jgi:hypothetical protein